MTNWMTSAGADSFRSELRRHYLSLGLDDHLADSFASSGRLTRGLIVLELAGQGHFSNRSEVVLPEFDGHAVLRGAVLVETLHRASVITDDIQDDDAFRRGQPTVHRRLGRPRAAAAADLLLSSAFGLASSISPWCVKLVLDTYAAMARGQSIDLGLLADDVDVVEPARLKTGSLLRLCFMLGTHYANRNGEQVELSGDLGEAIGIVFQLKNDLLNAQGKDKRSPGAATDLLRGNRSSVALAMPADVTDATEELREIAIAVVSDLRDYYVKVAGELARSLGYNLPETILRALSEPDVADMLVDDQGRV